MEVVSRSVCALISGQPLQLFLYPLLYLLKDFAFTITHILFCNALPLFTEFMPNGI